ncbi:exodeoxyribonuclease VII large subunit [Planctomycetota bacterium]
MQNNKSRTYTVSQVNSLIKVAIEENLPSRLIVAGEISDWKKHQSGHCYFLLKDQAGQLPCVMWKSKFGKVKFKPENGLAVFATGHIDVYPPQGKYQFYVDSIKPAGIGDLQLVFEQMVKKLYAEGLFDDEHKKQLPRYPKRIGVLTSESGAAVHDIYDSINARWPCVELLLFPVPVQGEGAGEKIAERLRDVNKRNKNLKLDLVILGRGGGSLEDLWAFNEEVLARAIFDSVIPVISAVGHEVDTTIADLVADRRVSTPTKAGVVAVPDADEIIELLVNLQKRLIGNIHARLLLSAQNLETILAAAVFKDPLGPVSVAMQMLDELTTKLDDSAKNLLAKLRERIAELYEQIIKIEPHRLLGVKNIELNNLRNHVQMALKAVTNQRKITLTARANRLEALNPKSVLQRGYSITTNKNTGKLISKPADIEIGNVIITELAKQNLIESKVIKK